MTHIMGVMATEHDVYQALRGVVDPELGSDIVELGMVTDVDLADGLVTVGVALTIAQCPMRGQIEQDTARKVMAIPGVRDVVVRTTGMTRKQRSELMATARLRAREDAEPTQVSPTTRVIAVGSGKGRRRQVIGRRQSGGGPGRSRPPGGLDGRRHLGFLGTEDVGCDRPACRRRRHPADHPGRGRRDKGRLHRSHHRVRGDRLDVARLMLSRALEQFLKQVAWGDLDYLVIDMPPGTGDIQMALARMVPRRRWSWSPPRRRRRRRWRCGSPIWRGGRTCPSSVSSRTWPGFTCEHGETHNLFGEGGGRELADSLGVPLIASVPLDPAVVSGGDTGLPVVRADPGNPAARAFAAAAERLVELVPLPRTRPAPPASPASSRASRPE